MIDEDLRTFILADGTLSGLLGSATAMYPLRLPQGAAKPCLVYTVNDGIANLQSGSVSPIRRYQVILKVYSEDYGDGRAIVERVRTILDGLYTAWTSLDVVAAHVTNVASDYGETHEHYSWVIDTTIHIRT